MRRSSILARELPHGLLSGLPAPHFGGPPYPLMESGAAWPCSGRAVTRAGTHPAGGISPPHPALLRSRWALTPPFHPCLALKGPSAVLFLRPLPCGVLPHPGYYPAPCPLEPGLSSPRRGRPPAHTRVCIIKLKNPIININRD